MLARSKVKKNTMKSEKDAIIGEKKHTKQNRIEFMLVNKLE